MKKSIKNLVPLFILSLLIFGKKTTAQDCQLPQGYGVLNGNNVSASIPANGSLFWTIENDTEFKIISPGSSSPFPSSIFAAGVWVAGKNNANELKLAAATYSSQNNHDYSAGPIHNDNGQLSFQCDDYDRTWEVLGYEISQHISDFEDNGNIDFPLANIYAYPGQQNPHFENIHGFELPNTSAELAPFHDKNNDGIYNPDNGDFPLPEGVSENKIPQQIIWGVFNDAGGLHTLSQSNPINMEVQLTAYSFYCNEDELLNNTIFTSHKLINRGNEPLDSMVFTKWVDFDLGCYEDDYLGCIPNLNTFYAYNEAPTDGGPNGLDCIGNVPAFGSNPPVQAVTFLNQEMSSFNIGVNGSVGNPPPPTTSAYLAIEYWNYMNGKWKDGSPITQGGNGYGGTQPTSFIYPDNPNDPNGWSMTTEPTTIADRRSVANVEFENSLSPDEFVKVDMAYTFYQDENLDHIETVNLVYDQTPILKQLYNNNFEDCNLVACIEDCVWTGDANRDSIVTNFDVLQIGLGLSKSGTARNTPLTFHPYSGADWNQEYYGIDLKHADCNSSGTIETSDFEWVDTYYGKSYKLGSNFDEYPQGSEFSIVTLGNNPMDNMQPGIGRAKVQLNQAEDIYGLAYTLEFDTTYLSIFLELNSSPWDASVTQKYSFANQNDGKGEIDYAFVKTDGENSTTLIDDIADIRFNTVPNDFELVQTHLRLKNIRVILNNGDILDYGAQDFLVSINNPDGNGQVLSNKNLKNANIYVYPNPTSDILNIKMENPSLINLSIFDIYGKKVCEKTKVTQTEVQLSTSNFSQGVYFLNIEVEGKEFVKKFIKM